MSRLPLSLICPLSCCVLVISSLHLLSCSLIVDIITGSARRVKIEVESAHISKVAGAPKYSQMIDHFTEKFDQHFAAFMEGLHQKSSSPSGTSAAEAAHLANLYTLLDFNGFYAGATDD